MAEEINDELAELRAEMAELRELLKSKKEDPDHEVEYTVAGGSPQPPRSPRAPRAPKPPRRPRRIIIDGKDIDIDVEGLKELGDTMSHYWDNVMSGVQESLNRSMFNLTRNFGMKEELRKAQQDARRVQHEARRAHEELKREMKTKKKVMERERKRMRRERMRFAPLSEEELENFLDTAPTLGSALSDPRRLNILKLLEKRPHYPNELTEQLDIKGGSLKHHLDTLLEAKFIAQEAVRGRYLISQLGIEALKLMEMLFRRHQYELRKESGEIEVDFDEMVEEEIEAELERQEEELEAYEEAEEELLDHIDEIEDHVDELEDELETIEEEEEEE
ncbi:MAG: helix-turn-helix transcriptional regulator [Candidatus Heimdallarchaeota archaeon]|nr:helix-turn-helix transcriptional regulator [Candidatus Heimdallarchaeota archaeon]